MQTAVHIKRGSDLNYSDIMSDASQRNVHIHSFKSINQSRNTFSINNQSI